MVYYLFVNTHISDPRGFRFYCLFSIVLVLLFYCFIADKRFYSFIADNSFTVLLLFYCFIADKRYYCFTVLLQIKGISGGFSLPWSLLALMLLVVKIGKLFK